MPDLQEQQLSSQDDALILASDGLWDVLTNQDAAQCIKDIKVILITSHEVVVNTIYVALACLSVEMETAVHSHVPSEHLQSQPCEQSLRCVLLDASSLQHKALFVSCTACLTCLLGCCAHRYLCNTLYACRIPSELPRS